MYFPTKYGIYQPKAGDMTRVTWYRDARGVVRFVAPSKRGVKMW